MASKRKADGSAGRAAKRAASGANTPVDVDGDYSGVDSGEDEEFSGEEASEAEGDNINRAISKFSIQSYSKPKAKSKAKKPDGAVDVTNGYFHHDYSNVHLKPDHQDRPLFVDPENGRIILEMFNQPLASKAADFLVNIAEPQSRPQHIHEYILTVHSLYAAVSVGLSAHEIITTLDTFSKYTLPEAMIHFINASTSSFGKVKLVLKHNNYFVESPDASILQTLLKDEVIASCRVEGTDEITKEKAPTMGGLVIPGTETAAGAQQAQQPLPPIQQRRVGGDDSSDEDEGLNDEELLAAATREDDDDDDESGQVHSFQVDRNQVETVQKQCLHIGYPMTEEYDFQNDDRNANLNIALRPAAKVRDYQAKSLSKMFGNGRARSGIIVLPCGAGKTLVGITAACTIKKSVMILCTSAMSVVQWRNEFLKWTNISSSNIAIFTSESKERFHSSAGIVISTYSMVTQTKGRAYDSQKMMNFIEDREWGLMILDEVHVVPASIFRRVTSRIAAHSKLGLTATLLREDDKIKDLNFLIGPKLFEANWMELAEQGHIARVQCAEVWCPMTAEFYSEYLRETSRRQTLLYTMNPKKFQACQFLIDYHESRGDKIIVFSDNVFALKAYAIRLGKAFIYGETSQQERLRILENFQHNENVNTIFLSKIGDTSLDLPEATCLIQISSHYGSRRQEAQRLGRILRAKRRNDEGFNAFFYSLVSKDTNEMYYSSKRQAFLVDQGYAFKVITHLEGIDNLKGLKFQTPLERRELLQEVMLANELSAEVEHVRNDLFDREGARGQRMSKGPQVKRVAGQLKELAGGQDMAYMEQNRTKNAELKQKKKKGPQSDFMKKIAREAERRKLNK